jgi:hypothetical protein
MSSVVNDMQPSLSYQNALPYPIVPGKETSHASAVREDPFSLESLASALSPATADHQRTKKFPSASSQSGDHWFQTVKYEDVIRRLFTS